MGSCSGPSQYAKVQMAWADLSSNAARSLCRPSEPSSLRNHFLSGGEGVLVGRGCICANPVREGCKGSDPDLEQDDRR